MSIPKADVLFESSWEVCNKVGGIYTVVVSKILPILEHYQGKEYILIGPFFQNKVKGEFEDKAPPEKIRKVFDILKQEGIHCYNGQWLVPGKPNTILIDFHDFFYKKDKIKAMLWEDFGIDSLSSQYDFDEPVVWSFAVGRFLEEFAKMHPDKRIVSQFHEWMAGIALLHLKKQQVKIGTVFTTHATMIGRTLASSDIDIYSKLNEIDADSESYAHNMNYKQQTEKACANQAGAFTTVSEITGIEAEHFHGRKPDVLLLNGLNIQKFPTFEENSLKHKVYRNKIREFLMSYFFPYYTFDLQKSLIYFICGRNEYHVKGVDLMIESLGDLNNRMKESGSDKTIVTFFFIPGNTRGIHHDIIENMTFFRDIKDSVVDNIHDIQMNLLGNLVSHQEISAETLFTPEVLSATQKKLRKLRRENELPPLSTHDMYDEDNNQILNAFRRFGLVNKPDDNVKVILYPIYLTGADGLLNTDYYETISGSHMGIFPSYYEPWGYTPLECAALGVAAVTTDLAGFGRFIGNHFQEKKNKGIFVIKRKDTPWGESVRQLSDVMFQYANMPHSERIENKINAKTLANLADWKVLIENYIKAHNHALDHV